MEIITIAMHKGGTGKTTTAAALAQASAKQGLRTLAVDLDPQGNLSFALAADRNRPGAYEMLSKETPSAAGTIQKTAQGIDVIAAAPRLAALKSGRGSARRLQAALEPVKGEYDLCFIDTPSAAGELQFNALQAADRLIIPLQADVFGTNNLDFLTDTIEGIRRTNPDLLISGIVLTQYNPRATLYRQMRKAIEAKAEWLKIPMLGAIRRGVSIQEAAALQKSLYDYAPRSNPARDYMEIFDALQRSI